MAKPNKNKKGGKSSSEKKEEDVPEISPVGADSESEGNDSDSNDSESVYDSEDDYQGHEDYGDDDDNNNNNEDSEDEDEFEDQGSSDEEDDLKERQAKPDDETDEFDKLEDNMEAAYEKIPRKFAAAAAGKSKKKSADGKLKKSAMAKGATSTAEQADPAQWMHTDDLSSDDEDEEGTGNRIGRVPLHWYEDYEHMGYDAHGSKVMKSASSGGAGDRLDQAIAQSDNVENGKFVVHDALNDKNVTLTPRQLELIRRVQSGAFAHPEFDAHPDYIDYYSSVPEISGLSSNRTEPKARFQPSQFEQLQVDQMLEKLERGDINMDYLTGKVRDMNDVRSKKDGEDSELPYTIWKGDEEDLLAMRKIQHIAPPKAPPPGHAESYRPPEEYIPTDEDLKQWEDMEVRERPHGRLIPKQFPNLRSVGAYEHTVTDTFERCLDLYLCPRVMKRKLNIDPESLVPKLPKASDLRPFPTAKCIEYKTEFEGDAAPLIRCLSPSPDGQYLASGATDGVVRLWEVQTGRMLRSWDINELIRNAGLGGDMDDENVVKPVVVVQWNPNRNHHCLVAAVGACVIIIATGTAGEDDAELTAALLAQARKGGNVTNEKAAKAVQWKSLEDSSRVGEPISAFDAMAGPIVALRTNRDVASLRWHAKGDYFVSVSPKAGSAAVLIHQLSKGNSQQPFSKSKGESQLACFHPNKPFLFVASPHHVRVYHLVKQAMVKREFSIPLFLFILPHICCLN